MWVESSILVGNQPVGLSMQLLEPDECERAAAAIAWFAPQSLSDAAAADAVTWRTFIETVIFQHVEFTVPEEKVEAFGLAWWNEATGRAMAEFVRTNHLEPAVNRYIDAIGGATRLGPRVS
jgi:hypothetical protein